MNKSKILIQEIKLKLSNCLAFVNQIPKSQQGAAMERIQEIYSQQNLEKVPMEEAESILKKLDYRYRFLRMAYPSIPAMETSDRYDIDNLNQKYQELELKKSKIAEKRENENQSKSFIYKDGEVKEGNHNPRVKSAFTNWYSGNADPEDMKKHKEMIQRQYYEGPLWEGQLKPKVLGEIPSGQLVKEGIENIETMAETEIPDSKDYLESGESHFENVKR